jgi:methylmalonyl-CoA/ethylmalonyl-CoA epimerase
MAAERSRRIKRLHFFGEKARFHHIGLAVKSIRDVSPSSEVIVDSVQKVFLAFISVGGVKIELLEPSGADSPMFESLKKNVKLLHICYSVPELQTAIKECRKYGFHCIARPVPAAAFHNRKIAWVYSSVYGLIELLESPGKPGQLR